MLGNRVCIGRLIRLYNASIFIVLSTYLKVLLPYCILQKNSQESPKYIFVVANTENYIILLSKKNISNNTIHIISNRGQKAMWTDVRSSSNDGQGLSNDLLYNGADYPLAKLLVMELPTKARPTANLNSLQITTFATNRQ